MSPQLAVFIVAVLAIVGWFALGTHVNIRKGHRYMEWLQAGLPLAGEKTTLRWLGSSVVQLKIEKAHEPFRRVEVQIVLEPRDVPPLWLLSRLRGRRDLLIVRTELRFVPKSQFEVLDPQAWSTQAVEREMLQQQWQLTPSGDLPFRVYALPPIAHAADFVAEVRHPELPLVRIGVRRAVNALEVQWRLPARPATSSRSVFESVQRLARRV